MTRESCNLEKDEAEILKPSSAAPSQSPSPPAPPPSPSALCLQPQRELAVPAPEMPENLGNTAAVDSGAGTSCKTKPEEEEQHKSPVRFINRCSSCQKRVGITGFRCRCGDLFCARHRYSDTHDCSFDYKAAGREQIAKANPLIRAAKLIKI